jgi:gamma-glutamylcyclotransferase (GGCT)/AIG2-like uncharacterized protein YtfP
MTSTDQGRSAFFYGTLMALEVLHRVCHGSTSPSNPIYATHNLKTYPAILPAHRRHRVKKADYPAILPHPSSTVRGTYVTGLTDSDIWRLDIFEGSEYERMNVRCRLIQQAGGEEAKPKVFSNVHVSGNEVVHLGSVHMYDAEGEFVEAETYVWIGGEERLEEREWDFAEFQREKMRFWIGEEGDEEYAGESPS